MMKKLYAVPVLILVMLLFAAPVFAGWTWCSGDPVIKLPGNQGVVHINVSVPQENEGARVQLDVFAPAGSRVLSSAKNVSVDLHPLPFDHKIAASVRARVPVMLDATKDGKDLGSQIFEKGVGYKMWSW
jgi:hypothetical protein